MCHLTDAELIARRIDHNTCWWLTEKDFGIPEPSVPEPITVTVEPLRVLAFPWNADNVVETITKIGTDPELPISSPKRSEQLSGTWVQGADVYLPQQATHRTNRVQAVGLTPAIEFVVFGVQHFVHPAKIVFTTNKFNNTVASLSFNGEPLEQILTQRTSETIIDFYIASGATDHRKSRSPFTTSPDR
jgi:hypothetical protein